MREKRFWGPWTIYRRRDDAWFWRDFEDRCALRGSSPSEVLTEAAREWLRRNPKVT